jgi:hypothetical protein
MEEKTVFELDLHEQVPIYNPGTGIEIGKVTCVPFGWIYQLYNTQVPVFVPMVLPPDPELEPGQVRIDMADLMHTR